MMDRRTETGVFHGWKMVGALEAGEPLARRNRQNQEQSSIDERKDPT